MIFMKDIFKYQAAVEPRELARYLTALAEGVEEGSLRISQDGRAFSVHPRGLVDLGLKIRRKGGRVRVSLDLGWTEEETALPLLEDEAEDDTP